MTAVSRTSKTTKSKRLQALFAMVGIWLLAAMPAAAQSEGASAAKQSAKPLPIKGPLVPMQPNEIPLRTAKDDKDRDKERRAELKARAAGLVAEAKQDMSAKRYADALKKADYVLGIDPKNAEAARIKKKAEPLAK